MIEETLGFGASLRAAAQTDAFLNRAVDQIFFWSFRKDLIECFVSDFAVHFLHHKILFEPPPAHRLLTYLRRCVGESVTLIIEIAILAQPGNHSFNYVLTRTSLRQPFAKLRD